MFKKIIGGLLLFTFMLSVAVLLNIACWSQGRDWWIHRDMTSWKTAEGTLDSATIEPGVYKMRPYNYLSGAYDYTVEGKAYHGTSMRYPGSKITADTEEARALVEKELALSGPRWQYTDKVIGQELTLLNAKGMKVKVTYYPPDPSEAMLVNPFEAGKGMPRTWHWAEGFSVILIGICALFLDAACVMGVIYGVKSLTQKKPAAVVEAPPVYVSAELCDAYIPLLDEGIAATQALRGVYKPARRVELDFQIRDFEALRGRAQSRLLLLAPYSMSLDRKYEFDSDSDQIIIRFKRAMDAIDRFHDTNLRLPQK